MTNETMTGEVRRAWRPHLTLLSIRIALVGDDSVVHEIALTEYESVAAAEAAAHAANVAAGYVVD